MSTSMSSDPIITRESGGVRARLSYFTEAIVPALTHEDPRYYTSVMEVFSAEEGRRYPGSSSLRQILAARALTTLRLWGMDWKQG
jgi:hypothetical protein